MWDENEAGMVGAILPQTEDVESNVLLRNENTLVGLQTNSLK